MQTKARDRSEHNRLKNHFTTEAQRTQRTEEIMNATRQQNWFSLFVYFSVLSVPLW